MFHFFRYIAHHITSLLNVQPTSGDFDPTRLLQRISHRKMINAQEFGVTLQMGNGDPGNPGNFLAYDNFTIFIGLFHNTLRLGHFNTNGFWTKNYYSLVPHPNLPLLLISDYTFEETNLYLNVGVTREQYEKYVVNVDNSKYNKSEVRPVLMPNIE